MNDSIFPHILLGIDGGGTKTEALAVSVQAWRSCRCRGPGSNYQSTGIERAEGVWQDLRQHCLSHFGAEPTKIAAAGFGIAGLDRPKDEAVLRPAFTNLVAPAPFVLLNDADLALRAGTADGIGVGVVSGTGCNAMGTNRAGKRFRVGGIGPEFGDLGSASDIGTAGLRAAFRSLDDRGPATMLVDLIISRLGLDRLDDIVDFFLADNAAAGEEPGLDLGMLAPLVFEAAEHGDGESIRILHWAGGELGLSARAVARNLFAPREEFPMLMGGSVLQRGRTPHVVDALVEDVRTEFPEVRPVVLSASPATGAVLHAADLYAASLGTADRADFYRRLHKLLQADEG